METGSGNRVSEDGEVPEFDRLELSASGQVRIEIGKPRSVRLELDDNLLALIETDVSNSQLTIKEREQYSSAGGLVVTVGVPGLVYVGLSGSGDIGVAGIDTKDFEISLDGNGSVPASGKTGSAKVVISGAGDVNALPARRRWVGVNRRDRQR
jgi:hypothetical protein